MSYGQPCRSTTAGPLLGPSSAYLIFRRPASICFSDVNDVCVPRLVAFCREALVGLVRASAEPFPSSATASVIPAAPRNRRRPTLISLDMLSPLKLLRRPLALCRRPRRPNCDLALS